MEAGKDVHDHLASVLQVHFHKRTALVRACFGERCLGHDSFGKNGSRLGESHGVLGEGVRHGLDALVVPGMAEFVGDRAHR